MTNQDLIFQTVLQAKCTSACWGSNMLAKEAGGEDIKCCMADLTLLTRWIDILQDFYCQFYLSTDPTTAFICLTEEEAITFVGKVKAFIKQ